MVKDELGPTPLVEAVERLRNSTHGSGWIVQVRPTTMTEFLESHPREWVDCLDPTFKSKTAERLQKTNLISWVLMLAL